MHPWTLGSTDWIPFPVYFHNLDQKQKDWNWIMDFQGCKFQKVLIEIIRVEINQDLVVTEKASDNSPNCQKGAV